MDGKRIISLVLCTLVSALMMLSVDISADPYSDPAPASERGDHFEWLVLVYIAGDNDLGENGEYGNAALMDLEEMEMSIPETGVRVLALTDLRGQGNSALYDIRPDTASGINSPEIPLSDIDPSWTDELDMGKGLTLQRFLEYSLNATSFDRSMFVMWDHGSGWYIYKDAARPSHSRGFAQDQTSGSIMYLDGMRDAFMDAESTMGDFKFDVIGHDTCYMGMMEVFYQLAPWSGIATGSMDEQPWYGYNYTFISSLDGGSPRTPEDLVTDMVDLFRDEYGSSSDTYHTIAAVDVDILSTEFLGVWDMLARSLYHRMYHLEEENNGQFSSLVGKPENVGIDSVDVGSFLTELIKEDLDHNITDLATSASGIYGRMLIDSWMKPDGRNQRGTGMTTYLPRNKQLAYKSVYDGSSGFLNLTADTYWDEMIREFKDPSERISLDLSVVDSGEGAGYDLVIDLTDVRSASPVPLSGADIHINGTFAGQTNGSGSFILEDISPGLYTVEARSGELFDRAVIKALNRPPFPRITVENDVIGEGMELIVSGAGSTDPDDDRITFRWDLDESNGLDDVDSTSPTVKLTYPDEGSWTVRLTVNDSVVDVHTDRLIEVINIPPVARLYSELPSGSVKEDEMFVLDGSDSYDVQADMEELRYRFLLDGEVTRDWEDDPTCNMSIPEAGIRNLTLQVRDMDGGEDNASMMINVIESDPVAVITGPSSVFEDEIVSFSGNGSYDTPSDMDDLVFRWFTDGEPIPSPSNRWVDVSWSTSGLHSITLEVEDNRSTGVSSQVPRDEKEITVLNRPPSARIDGPETADVLDSIRLSGANSTDTVSDIAGLSYEWDTDGDGEVDFEGMEVVFNLSGEGSLRVMLRVTDDDGDVSRAYHTIIVRNIPPEPNVTIIGIVWEDSILDITAGPDWDSPGDEPSLEIEWKLDGEIVGTGRSIPLISIPTSGNHELRVTAVDDQGKTGVNITIFEVRNPVPNVVLSGIPVEIDAGEEFTAMGYRTTDNPSDMETLVFQWFVDGELQEDRNAVNETFRFDCPGKRTISLKVTDDDGDSYMVDLEVKVVEEELFARIVGSVISVAGMAILIVFLLLLALFIFRVASSVRKLGNPAPKEEDEQDPGSSAGEIDFGPSDTDDDHGPVTGTVPDREEDTSGIDGRRPGAVPPPPDMDVPEIPAGPSAEKVEIAPFDEGLLKR